MTASQTYRVGTRASPLALAQSELFCAALARAVPGVTVTLVPITTSGDRIQDRVLGDAGGKGLFVKEIEAALLAGTVDWAVHSMKDLPAELPAGCAIGCIPARLNYEDVLVTPRGMGLRGLKPGAVLGTSSLRRRMQLSRLRPDLRFAPLRGNIDTRVKKMTEGVCDGVVLARAGLLRLKLAVPHMERLPILPAPGQGCLAVEIRAGDERVRELLEKVHDAATDRAVRA
ncbi:MAG: hydroxymethylbilane synthase, partial [Candidatus Binatia bacterium]